jgi:hypothetical protein
VAVAAVAAFSVILGVICMKNKLTYCPILWQSGLGHYRGLTLATTQISFFLFLQMFCNSFPLEETGY